VRLGLSGGLGFHTIQNDVSAYLGDQAQVKAARDVELTALSNKEAEGYAVSAAGGAVGLAGGVTVLTIGEMPDDETVQDLAAQGGNEEYTNPSEYANEQARYDFMGEALSDTYGMDAIKSEDEPGRIGGVRCTRGSAPAGTSAFIGKSAVVEAGRDIRINARERIDADMTSGSAAVGLASLGGGVGIANVRSQVRAYIDDDIPGHTSSINAAGNVDISASLDEKTLNQAFAGGLSAFVSVSGSGELHRQRLSGRCPYRQERGYQPCRHRFCVGTVQHGRQGQESGRNDIRLDAHRRLLCRGGFGRLDIGLCR
jgi:hypothetical protein